MTKDTGIAYDVQVPDLTAEMLDELLGWIGDTWGGLDMLCVTPKIRRSAGEGI